jgi:hypothetical protein
MITIERVIDFIGRISNLQPDAIHVFWYQVLDNRDEVCRQIETMKGDLCIAPLVLRGQGFDHPNALMSDFIKLISTNREVVTAEASRAFQNSRPLVILLLSRTTFTLPQVSSPTELPDWYPQIGGTTISVTIRDLITTADGYLNIPEARVNDMCERLHTLERVLLKRLDETAQLNKRAGQSLFSFIKDDKSDEKYPEFIQAAIDFNSGIKNPSGFRPSAGEGKSFIGRIIRLMYKTTPDEIRKRSKALSMALGIPDDFDTPVNESVITILMRPTSQSEPPATRLVRNALVTIFASSQFITAASHADAYPAYPVLLIQNTSYNLRMTLNALTDALERAPINQMSVE